MNLEHLPSLFQSLTDDELLSRVASGSLTAQAHVMAEAELRARGLAVPAIAVPPPAEDGPPYEGDYVQLEGSLTPQEAQVIVGFLQSAGIDATAGDVNLVQTHSLLSIALGGARVRVPAARLAESRELLRAFRAGEFELGDDFDTSAS